MQDIRKLKVWQRSHELTLYRITTRFPDTERYGLISQIRRCSASIGANLAEGCGRSSDADFARFVYIAMGSASELQYHLILGHDLGFIESADYEELERDTIGIKRMLTGLLQKLKADS